MRAAADLDFIGFPNARARQIDYLACIPGVARSEDGAWNGGTRFGTFSPARLWREILSRSF
jgi:hypothetical protein